MDNTLRKAAEMALEALEELAKLGNGEHYGNSDGNVVAQKTIPAIRQALAQLEREQHCRYCNGIGRVVCDGRCLPKQEPVSFEDWLKNQHGDPEEIGFLQALRITYYAGADSHTTPPSKPWVSLNKEEFDFIYSQHDEYDDFAKAIDAKLKEKNGFL